ncbi:MAG: PfkB family carbohydrate kinase [bacterium]|nr:PfkB family carbohydrate kinase [bacterium]
MDNIYVLGSIIFEQTTIVRDVGDVTTINHIGGKGFNIAKEFKNLGIDVHLYGVIANDALGNFLISQLNKFKINYLGPQVEGKTGIYQSIHNNGEMIFSSGDYRIYKNFYFDKLFAPSEINNLYVLSTTLPEKQLIKISFMIKKFEKKSIICMCMASPHDWKKVVQCKGFIDILIGNKSEINNLIDNFGGDKIKALNKLNIKTILITLGAKGVNLFDLASQKVEEIRTKPIPRYNVISTVGAGDVFAAAFLYSYVLQKDNLKNSTLFAMKRASMVVKSALPYLID